MGFFFTKLFRNVILLAVLFNGIQYYLKWKSYNIQVKDFKNVASKAAGGTDAVSSVSGVIAGFRNLYKQRIPYDLYWVPLSAGGLHLRAQFVYADITEYVAILAAGGSTIGRGGFHWSNNTCTVLTGQVIRYSDAASSVVKVTFTPGQNFRHGQFESYIYEFQANTHALCYGRGFIPASAVWTTTGALSSGDPLAAAKLLYVYGKAVFDNIAHSATNVFNHYKDKASKFEL